MKKSKLRRRHNQTVIPKDRAAKLMPGDYILIYGGYGAGFKEVAIVEVVYSDGRVDGLVDNISYHIDHSNIIKKLSKNSNPELFL